MLIKLVEKNAEITLLTAIEERCRSAVHLGGVLVCSFSQASFKTEPEQILPFLKDILQDNVAELYFCDDGDLFIYWRGRLGETSKALIQSFRSHFSDALLSFDINNIFKVFDIQTQAEDLRLFIRNKLSASSPAAIEELEKKTAPARTLPQKLIKLELSSHQQDAFKKAFFRRPNRSKTEILVVEDQDFSRKLLMGLLQRNHVCFGARNAYEALHYFAEHAPDMIFLDIELPDHDGHSLAGFFKNLDPQTYIVMVTGNNYKKDVEKARENKVQGFVAKPYSKQSIFNIVEAFVKSKSKRKIL